ncbi:MAG: ABC transporter ATP-binding protein [Burkholderiales bacterium]|nr:ABC transporter ATP-binding protein [Burkholderiales bacterium]
MNGALLEVSGLRTVFPTRSGELRAVDDVSFSLTPGEVLGLVGESGSGKSVTGFSLMGLIERPGHISAGSIRLQGRELVGLAERDWRAVRGRDVAMVFQDPMLTLNPVLRIDTQLVEAIRAHAEVGAARARDLAVEALTAVGIPSAAERLLAYPHQFSGGMRQRVAIAIALLHKPKLLIADEPTTALDVTIQGQIVSQVQALAAQHGTAVIWITHDLAVVSSFADRIAVMYAGRVVEQGSTADVLRAPVHPYTRGLLRSLPSQNAPGHPLAQIPGAPPKVIGARSGCAFAPRCDVARPMCLQEDPAERTLHAQVPNVGRATRMVRCHVAATLMPPGAE